MNDLPIGVFDSGVGGLTVLNEIHRSLPAESTIYLGDSRRAPYGSRSPEDIIRFTVGALDHLRGLGVKALVLACNSATSVALDAATQRYDLPVVGVIEPTARLVSSVPSARIGVIGTAATIGSGAYSRAIRSFNPSAEVVERACPRLAGLVEDGQIDTVRTALTLAADLMPLRRPPVDILVLGCTHYPFLRGPIARLLGPTVRLVESGPPLVAALAALMDSGRLARTEAATPSHRWLTTGDAEAFRRLASLLWPGKSLTIEETDIEVSNEPILLPTP